MEDILIHYGVPGMKWGVRHDYEPIGKKYTSRNFDRSMSNDNSKVDDYKNLTDSFYTQLQIGWNEQYNKAKLSKDRNAVGNKRNELAEQISIVKSNLYQYANVDRFKEALKLVGINEDINYDILSEEIKSGNAESIDKALKILAANEAFSRMDSGLWLPSELSDFSEAINETQEGNEMIRAVEKAGLSGLDPPVLVRKYEGRMVYVMFDDNSPHVFEKDQIKEMQKFALDNDLFFKDFRTRTNNTRARQKNVSTSTPVKVTKRNAINVSDEERKNKSVRQSEDSNDILVHHGILGQKWGIRRYQNPDGSLTNAGRKRYAKSINRLRKLDKKKEQVLNSLPDGAFYFMQHPFFRTRFNTLVSADKRGSWDYQEAQYAARRWFNKMQNTFKNVNIDELSSDDRDLIEKYLKDDDYHVHYRW